MDVARSIFAKVWDAWKGNLNVVSMDAAIHLSNVLRLEGRRLDPSAVLADAVLRATSTVGLKHVAAIDALHELGKMLREQGDKGAEEVLILQTAFDIATDVLGPEDQLTIWCKLSLMVAHTYKGNLRQETKAGLKRL
ncbi:hypothetical protein BKA56DRAFT_712823 [Ilyonectria sp. MPI-CAGE-AT-0026]|nr:hypothetical protein BKA56DRAFT_712823 [Ilyonectria sp. MPI-CAGE-AT-0026]